MTILQVIRKAEVINKNICGFVRRYVTQNAHTSSYYHYIGKEPLAYRTLGQQMERAADKFGDNDAIVSYHEGKRLTYSQALKKIDQFAAGLLKLGLSRGDRIAIWAPNTMNWYIAVMAAAKAGLISVAINHSYQIPEMAYCIKKVGIKAIVTTETFKTQNYYDMICEIVPEIKDTSDGIIRSSEYNSLRAVIMDSDNDHLGTFKFEDICSAPSNKDIIDLNNRSRIIQPDDPCNIQFTSGTTGKPKAAVMSHYNFVNNGIHVANRMELDEKYHKICVQVPLFHAYGVVISLCVAIEHGSTVVLPSPGFNPEQSLRAIVDEKCTLINGTPTMYVDLIAKQKELNLPITTAEIAITGGATCSPQLFRNIKSTFGLRSVKTVFGMTELSPVCFISTKEDSEYQVTETVGFILDHLEAKVTNEQGLIVPFGTPGELCVRGYSTMLEYFDDPQKTRETISNDRWLRTGDQFVLQEDGYGRIIGRYKEMIIRGGENIFPKEIEDFLSTHPDILENYAFGVPDERLGEEICVHIRTSEKGKSLTADDIRNFCKGSIAHFKIPRYIKFVDDFPKTTSGKIQKFKLQEQFVKPA
ncbi:medium-chain acyl-CoA ligase ACSF2, mitochondrial-like isoform X2 [Bradysia coprophila]|uniref:medium-chain acyl-CoA ligase ACSF2, mitochondrial-like isoform X2 n=1 Tax=Bradysia coprophila TaxID=38358 RepID=UPI00187DA606|nr:medium-chain acyl-CoA ligase ACSF2, mitochondrial-like isoform X2 [Bradysia coprophila]